MCRSSLHSAFRVCSELQVVSTERFLTFSIQISPCRLEWTRLVTFRTFYYFNFQILSGTFWVCDSFLFLKFMWCFASISIINTHMRISKTVSKSNLDLLALRSFWQYHLLCHKCEGSALILAMRHIRKLILSEGFFGALVIGEIWELLLICCWDGFSYLSFDIRNNLCLDMELDEIFCS